MVKMMKTLVVTTCILSLFCLRANDLTARYDRELFVVLRWEILWHQLPIGSRAPARGMTKFAVQLASNNLSYCSHELGVCERYQIGEYRNWEAFANALCNDERSDEDALRAFVDMAPRSWL
jgi:hypothetical protein